MNLKKIKATHIILFLFICLTSFTLYLSSLFSPSFINTQNQLLIANFLEAKNAPLINELIITNNNGEFVFSRDISNPNKWNMIKPIEINADEKIIISLIEYLQNLKIKKTYPADKTNNTNYNLAPPLAQIKFKVQDKEDLILFGLLNTIDKSIYTKKYNSQEIYHVDAPDFDFENAKTYDFLVMNVFQIQDFDLLSIYFNGQTKADFDVSNVEAKWVDSLKNIYNPVKIEDLKSKAFKARAQFVIEKPNETQFKFIENQFKKLSHKLVVSNSKEINSEVTFLISQEFNQFPGIELQQENFSIVKISNSSYYYLFKRSDLDFLQIKNSDLVKEN